MFTRIDICLTSPICSCETQDLAWTTPRDLDNLPCLELKCKTCSTTLVVPNEKFVARFVLSVPYPKQRAKQEPARVLKLVPRAEQDADADERQT